MKYLKVKAQSNGLRDNLERFEPHLIANELLTEAEVRRRDYRPEFIKENFIELTIKKSQVKFSRGSRFIKEN